MEDMCTYSLQSSTSPPTPRWYDIGLLKFQLDGKPDVTIGEVLYECHTPNSYKNTKVIALVMEAESYDLQKFLAEK